MQPDLALTEIDHSCLKKPAELTEINNSSFKRRRPKRLAEINRKSKHVVKIKEEGQSLIYRIKKVI